jgi:hypothetical protein
MATNMTCYTSKFYSHAEIAVLAVLATREYSAASGLKKSPAAHQNPEVPQ